MKPFTHDIFKRSNCLYLSKLLTLTLLFFTSVTLSFAQNSTEKIKPKGGPLLQLLEKRKYAGPKTKYPMASREFLRKAKDATGQPLNFPDLVWFPGEWEEVKAIVVSPHYMYLVPGKENDERYGAKPLFEGYAEYIFMKDRYTPAEKYGGGPYVTYLDTDSEYGKIFLRIMDGIQKGGAEAWVRIESDEDEEKVLHALKENGFLSDKVRFFVCPGNSFWFRDCGPICFYYGDDDKLAMLDFLYARRPLDDKLPSYLHRKFDIPNYENQIIWEGGNCVVDGVGTLVTSSAVYDENIEREGQLVWDGNDTASIHTMPKEPMSPMEVKAALKGMLGQLKTVVLQRMYYDGGTGHVDLYVDAKDENGFLLGKMPEKYDTWTDYDTALGNSAILFNKKSFFSKKYYNKGDLPFPAKDDGAYFENELEYYAYARTYANHTFVNNYILQPCFSPVGEDGMPTAAWDRANIELMKKLYPGYTFYCIDMRNFDGTGGSIHCVTKQIPADNPVRILHQNIHDKVNPGELSGIPFCAYITNRSGIKEAQLLYCVNGGEWNSVPLNGNSNCWSCRIPIEDLTAGKPLSSEGIFVIYFIKATSNNGKTITKPLNANHGDYYNFTLTNEVSYDENKFDFDTEPLDKRAITYRLNTQYLTEDLSSDTPTDIKEVNNHAGYVNDNAWYTIGGLRLSSRPSTKGFYIYNGKKVVIR